MALPSIYQSCNNKCTDVSVGAMRVTFSYTTPVAFYHPATGSVCSENVWSKTTGRHLNECEPNKAKRVPHDLFATLLALVSSDLKRDHTKAGRMIDKHRATLANAA